MKQKLVVKVCMNGPKSRSKALKIVVGFSGVVSVTLQPDKDQIEVTGNDVDVVKIAKSLRKVGFVEVVSVTPVEEKKGEEEKKGGDEKKGGEEKKPPDWHPCVFTPYPYMVRDDDPLLCSIL